MAHLNSRYRLEGHITVFALRPDGSARDRRTFRNLIVNSGLDLLGSINVANAVNKFAVGTGTTQPAPSQTGLVSAVSVGGSAYHSTTYAATVTNVAGVEPNEYGYTRVSLVSATSTADLNLEEIGWFNTSSVLFNRQRFKDASGVDTTFTLLNGERLVAELEVRFYPPSADSESVLVLNSGTTSASTHTLTTRPQRTTTSGVGWGSGGVPLNMWTNYYAKASSATTLTARSGSLGGTSASTSVIASYTSGNYYRDATFTWTSSDFTQNIGVIGWGFDLFQTLFTPTISKTSLNRLQLTIRHSWSTVTA